MTHPMAPVDAVLDLYQQLGSALFLDQPVTQIEHALQIAWLAEQAGAPLPLVAAAFLHDIGHLLAIRFATPGIAASGDPRHAETGAAWLAANFPPSVVEPVRLHVMAKRYLCSVEPGYPARLSSASKFRLDPQGGLMTPTEAATFLATPFAADALKLRRWDEMARVPSLATPSVAHFRPCLEAVSRHPHAP